MFFAVTQAMQLPGPHRGPWSPLEVWTILVIVGLVVAFMVVVFVRAHLRTR